VFQQLIDKHLARAGVLPQPAMVVNLWDTVIALVEAGEGIAIMPSFSLAACRNRKVTMSRLINPQVTLDYHQIRHRGRKLPPVADEFTAFLQDYLVKWAERARVL
jgi:DNA-binding transcriptional LysR family regulator